MEVDLEMTAELKSSVDVHLNALGQGLHTAAATVLSTTARPALDGLWTDTLLRFNFHANDDLKFTRIQIQAADLRTRDFSLRILRALDKEHGVPPGEYKRAKEAFVAAIQAVSKSADRVLDLMDSNVEYIDPFGGVVVGKEEVRKKLDEWYGAGLTDALEPTEVYTP
ncbi:hypothetical protein DFJ74DRAFT_365764 [Hyaloraphidium curvatum]|nr:hypothetical protein DFJ74DRAFT_365764 [Hyaloraphidium curvatum]